MLKIRRNSNICDERKCKTISSEGIGKERKKISFEKVKKKQKFRTQNRICRRKIDASISTYFLFIHFKCVCLHRSDSLQIQFNVFRFLSSTIFFFFRSLCCFFFHIMLVTFSLNAIFFLSYTLFASKIYELTFIFRAPSFLVRVLHSIR